ncbi:hypothetical protein [Segatella copri]|uniref:Uncharacterized protein n=2 Tax=Segatella copri TaxID=165179 RepID=A0A646FQ80_9BACT|nr:hypothetical protein [Segatella copri]MQM96065.1 hypothetical protein [Segatella copri]MQN03308.1 hypothetical protein [Segatella copri]
MKSNFYVGSTGASYDNVTGKFEWTKSRDNWMNLFTNLKGQLSKSKYKHLKIKLTGATHGYRLLFYKGNENFPKVMNVTDLKVDLDLTKLELTNGWTIDEIDRICISGLDENGTLTLTPADVTLETDDIETLTVTTTVDASSAIDTPFQWYKGTEPRTESVENYFGKTGKSVLWGYGYENSETNGYFNLNGYSALLVKVNNFDATKNQTFRVMSADNSHAVISMTDAETLASFNVSKCTSLKSGGGGQNLEQEITSIDFIGEYQAVNTKSPFDIAASTGSKVSYDRNFTNGQACTICLPFALTAKELAKVGKAYTLSAVNGSTATFTPATAIEAYKPYLLIPSDDGKLLENIAAAKDIADVHAEAKTSVPGSYSFVGTLQAETSVKKDGMEVYGFSASQGKFVHAGSNASIKAFRAYIAVPTAALSTAASRSIDIDFGGTTGINEIQNAQSSSAAATYDVAGKRVDKNYKGVVIRNGKKMIQK